MAAERIGIMGYGKFRIPVPSVQKMLGGARVATLWETIFQAYASGIKEFTQSKRGNAPDWLTHS